MSGIQGQGGGCRRTSGNLLVVVALVLVVLVLVLVLTALTLVMELVLVGLEHVLGEQPRLRPAVVVGLAAGASRWYHLRPPPWGGSGGRSARGDRCEEAGVNGPS